MHLISSHLISSPCTRKFGWLCQCSPYRWKGCSCKVTASALPSPSAVQIHLQRSSSLLFTNLSHEQQGTSYPKSPHFVHDWLVGNPCCCASHMHGFFLVAVLSRSLFARRLRALYDHKVLTFSFPTYKSEHVSALSILHLKISSPKNFNRLKTQKPSLHNRIQSPSRSPRVRSSRLKRRNETKLTKHRPLF